MEKKRLTKENIILISIVILIILFDQGMKIWVQNAKEIVVLPGILNFKLSQNHEAAYGIGSNSTIMYVLTNFVILGVIFKFMMTQNEFVDKKLKIFLSFILAGGISNVLERVIRGYVSEFIHWTEKINLPILNIADLFVLIGWIAVVAIFTSFTAKEWKNKKEGKSKEG